MPSWLYRFEAKGIQSWILGSRRLKDMTGGSELIEGLLTENPPGATEVSRAAGAATLRFERDEDLAAWVRELPKKMHAAAPGLHVVQAAVQEISTFDATHRALHTELGAQRQRVPPSLPVPGPFVHRAGETGRAAVARDRDSNGDLLDAAMREKRRHGAASQRADGSKFGQRFFPPELHHLDLAEEDSWPEGPVAVIHADGNRMGERLLGLKTQDDYRRFSADLTAATKQAVHEALRKTFPDWKKALPCRPVVLGGDDVTVILPARLAFTFTETFMKAFHAARVRGESVSASAGIACVRNGYPFSQAYALAEDLCKLAKGLDNAPGGALAFARVTTARSEGYVEDATPYSLDDLTKLHSLAEHARRLPRGKLREWLPLAETDAERAAAFWRRFKTVSGKRSEYRDFVDAATALGVDMESSSAAARQRLIFSALELNQLLGRDERPSEGAE